jgi:uncharacterized protein (TIGR04255 family)
MSAPPVAANPLRDPAPSEVPLRHAPLICVLAQVKFSEVLSVELPEVVAKFQAAIAHTYPVLSRETGINITVVAPGMPVQPKPVTHWRFTDAPTDWQWRITLTSQFLTLEVRRYTSRSEFFERLEMVLEALQLHIKPALVMRLGVRYINRIVGQELSDVAQLVRPEIAGVVGTNMVEYVSANPSEAMFKLNSENMGARWGLLPANAVIDASIIEPVAERCFMLDLDVFDETPTPFDASATAARGKAFAQRSYAFFRWAVTDEFLRRYGGRP